MSACGHADVKPEVVADAVTNMKLERERSPDAPAVNGGPAADEPSGSGPESHSEPKPATTAATNGVSSSAAKSRSQSRSPVKKGSDGDEVEEKVGGDITVKQEPGQPPKLARSSSQKVPARPPRLFNHLPDSTAEAQATFEMIEECTYANKHMGYTEHAMECDCAEEWGKLPFPLLSCHEFIARLATFCTLYIRCSVQIFFFFSVSF